MQKTEADLIRRRDREYFMKKLKNSRISYLMMAPFLILFITLTVVPVFSAIALSFTNFNMLQTPSFVGLVNYERLFLGDPIFLRVLQNTLLYAVIIGPIGYFLSFFFAWMINEFGRKMRAGMTLVFYAPALTVGGSAFIWSLIFSGDTHGIVNSVLLALGIVDGPVLFFTDYRYVRTAIIIVQLWASLGAGFLAFIAGFQSLDSSLTEAGAIDGVRNRFQELWYVLIPQMAPQMMFAAVMTISATFGISDIIISLAGFPTTQYSGDSIVTYLRDIGIVRYEMGYASAIAVFLFGMMLIFHFIIKRALKQFRTD
jgi:multiple sugar transport system permease protein